MVKTWENEGLVVADWAKKIIKMILESRQYQRTDYKIHTKEASRIPDHCSWHGLSDPFERDFQKECLKSTESSHNHDLRCPRCEMAKQVLEDIKTMSSKIHTIKQKEYETMPNEQNKEAIVVAEQEFHDIKTAIEHIEEFKRHQLRASRSERHRIKLIQGISEGSAFVLLDYAQKMLPTYSRETQAQYFGKDAAASWHIAHVTTLLGTKTVHHTFVHVQENGAQV